MNYTKKQILVSVAVLLVIVGAFFGGLKAGGKGYVFDTKGFQIVNKNGAPANVDYDLLWNALDQINQKYIDKPVDQQKILYGAVSGAVAAIGDPYTMFFSPDQLKDFNTQLNGSFEGIGAEVGMQNGSIVIIAPLDESPAKKAGLESGDIILKVDDVDVTADTIDTVVGKIRGPKGTNVKLTIYRTKTSKQLDFNIVRDTIQVKSVKWSVKNDGTKKIEYIQISEFGDDTDALFAQAAQDAVKNKADGIVLDLRDDPGGYLDTAVQVVSYWVDQGKLIVTEAHSDGTSQKYTGLGNNILSKIPTIVLINGGSASAAEITSGALHDYGYAKLVGLKSFGKGSVQQLIDLPVSAPNSNQNLTAGIKITIAKWLTPKGINLNHNGLDPDIKVDITQDQINAKQDPQLDKALELLK